LAIGKRRDRTTFRQCEKIGGLKPIANGFQVLPSVPGGRRHVDSLSIENHEERVGAEQYRRNGLRLAQEQSRAVRHRNANGCNPIMGLPVAGLLDARYLARSHWIGSEQLSFAWNDPRLGFTKLRSCPAKTMPRAVAVRSVVAIVALMGRAIAVG
jgi:hypothetical protein